MIASITKQPVLDDSTRQRMFHLHTRYFANHSHDQFVRDLREKEWVILLKEESEIVGFTTIMTLVREVEGRRRGFLFSGDTIVDDRHRCSCTLAGAFCHLVERFRPDYDEFYWFLISKGHRTFRFLPTFFLQFYPGLDESESPHLKTILDTIATDRFGDAYSPDTGLIVFKNARDRLRPRAAQVPEGHAQCPYVKLFLDKNPGYANGDELACIASLASDNLKPTVAHVIKRTPVEWVE